MLKSALFCGNSVYNSGKTDEKNANYSTDATANVVISRCSCEISHMNATAYGRLVHRFTHSPIMSFALGRYILYPVPTGPNTTNAINL
jgi:hypothetical protein